MFKGKELAEMISYGAEAHQERACRLSRSVRLWDKETP